MVYFPWETECLITGPSDKKALLYNSTCHYSFNLGNRSSKPTIKFKILINKYRFIQVSYE